MARSHLYRPIQDAQGNLRTGAQVRVFADGLTTLTNVPLFASNIGSATLPPIHTVSSGIVEFYTEEPQRFRIGIKVGDEPEVLFEAVDTSEPGYTEDDPAVPAHEHPHEHTEYYSADNPPPPPPGLGTQANQVDLAEDTTSRTLTDADSVVFSDGTNVVLTLPDPTTRSGRTYTIKNLNVSPLTVDGGAALIDGTATRTLAQFDSLTVISNGTIWGVV